MISRADNSVLAEWWRSIDRLLLAAILFLMLCGMLLSFAASPSVAERIGVDSFHFVKRHAAFLVPAVIAFLGASLLTPRQVRRSALILFGVSILLMIWGILPLQLRRSEFVEFASWCEDVLFSLS